MKAWVLAVGLSLGLHAVLVVSYQGVAVAVVAAAPRDRVVDGVVVEFTPVVEAPVESARPVVPQPLRVVFRKVIRASPGPFDGETAAVEAAASVDAVFEIEASGQNAQTPHPDPLPIGGKEESETELVALVHARLAAMAEGCYPAAARRFQQRGTVQLSFCLDARGGTASTSVTQSSGAELLDAAAQGCVVQKAAPFPLEAASHCFSVPVRFGAR